jgi:hypothetical protein
MRAAHSLAVGVASFATTVLGILAHQALGGATPFA